MKTISTVVLLFVSSLLLSQTVFSPLLMSSISDEAKSNEYINVNIFFTSNYDIYQLSDELDANHASFDQRVKAVTTLLKENSLISQNEFAPILEELLSQDSKAVGDIRYYWGVNMLNIDIKKDYVYRISEFKGIKYMDLNSPRYRIPEVEKSDANSEKVVNGAEPGLKTINAHKLWELGYTGRNILFLSMDTGVYPEHPAIGYRFAGNHFPLSQCWYGVRSEEPADNASSSHGTHTTGTTLGLDPATNDTIGVAFNAFWIASDPVASTDADLLNPGDFMNVFQWVLDPDGNPETTDDVPRVINNSWGYDYTLALQFGACEMAEAEILVALETAGICSPFSAGNEGPAASTNGFPAMRAFNEVNPMSIGALTASNAIASFSSRGPTPCITEEGVLQIKPEVSAPGVNIRSCVGTNSYEFLQGTSMACPHVSGALLLLAEAFPMASAYELKYSLYATAIDLGDVGEDNVYGRGLIDVLAAFNYLAMTYTAVPPVTDEFDLAADITSPDVEYLCPDASNTEIQVLVSNSGQSDIDSFYVKIFVNEILVCDSLVELILEPSQDFLFTSDAYQLAGGKNFVHAYVKPYHTYNEFNRFNNGINKKIYVLNEAAFPFEEDFEAINADLTDSELFILNPDSKNKWENYSWGSEDQYKAMGMKFLNYIPRDGTQDLASLPKILVPDSDSVFLSFTYAYKNRLAQFYKDSLIVEISTDCGLNYNEILFADGGQALATVSGDAMTNLFKPVNATDFDTLNISLDSYRGQEVVVRFKTKNDGGSIVYIDKIEILDLSINAVDELSSDEKIPYIYPNPANGVINVDNPGETQFVRVCDISGKLILTETIKNGSNQLNIDKICSGIYFISFEKSRSVQKVVIQ
jgi:bacillopeptidase F